MRLMREYGVIIKVATPIKGCILYYNIEECRTPLCTVLQLKITKTSRDGCAKSTQTRVVGKIIDKVHPTPYF